MSYNVLTDELPTNFLRDFRRKFPTLESLDDNEAYEKLTKKEWQIFTGLEKYLDSRDPLGKLSGCENLAFEAQRAFPPDSKQHKKLTKFKSKVQPFMDIFEDWSLFRGNGEVGRGRIILTIMWKGLIESLIDATPMELRRVMKDI